MSQTRVFLNYAREDQETVTAIYRKLQKYGFDPWMDSDILGGTEWEPGIRRAVRQSDYFLACISTRSVKKTGVIEDEINLALKIRAEDHEGGRFVIPVRLDEVEIPASLAKLQWVDLFRSDGWPRLLRALGYEGPLEKPWYARPMLAGAVLLSIVVIAAVLWLTRPSYVQDFVETRRPGGKPSDQALIGVTISELRKSAPADPKGIRMLVEPAEASEQAEEWTPVRKSAETVFKNGARVRLAVESTRPGFLYVVDQEQLKGDKLGEPALIFPTARTSGSGNEVRPGRVMTLPRPDAEVRYWNMERQHPDYLGELLSIIITPREMPGLERLGKPGGWTTAELNEFIDTWRRAAKRVYDSASDALPTLAEIEAGKNTMRLLSDREAAPQTIYAVSSRPGQSAVVQIALRISD